ncbi:MAG TPA: hypothetical protein VFE37_16890 [Chloroflexota bacterium]|nr:hypothetical protein [Chloroflexota bacterium]
MGRWTRAELDALESEDYWDTEHGYLVEPTPGQAHSSVFALTLTREEARQIGEAAERAGESVLDFIRQAALERAARAGAGASPPDKP